MKSFLLLFSLCAVVGLPAQRDTFPVVQITPDNGRQHWFGYYDKQQIDPSGRYALGMEVDLFFAAPTPEDTLDVMLIDLENDFNVEYIGRSTSWGWQQGCMLQWIPGSDEEVIWNDNDGEDFVARVYNVRTKEMRTLPRPIYTLSPDGSYALSVDFGRLQFFRPGYGYPSKRLLNVEQRAPEDDGIWKLDLQTGKSELLLSYAEVARFPRERGSTADFYHWINHLLISPDGERFIFLNRSRPIPDGKDMYDYYRENPNWRGEGVTSGSSVYLTRAFTAKTDGSDLFNLNDSGIFSHFIWRRSDTITAWAMDNAATKAAFYDFPDLTHEAHFVDTTAMPYNGHNTFLPATDYAWILNDTYPIGKARKQQLYLYHVPTATRVDLGRFFEPKRFKGQFRCDLHPRADRSGRRVFFDSTHRGGMRQIYMVSVGSLLQP